MDSKKTLTLGMMAAAAMSGALVPTELRRRDPRNMPFDAESPDREKQLAAIYEAEIEQNVDRDIASFMDLLMHGTDPLGINRLRDSRPRSGGYRQYTSAPKQRKVNPIKKAKRKAQGKARMAGRKK